MQILQRTPADAPEELLEPMCRELYPKLHSTAPKASLKIYWLCFGKSNPILPSESKRTACRSLQAKVKKTEAEKLAIKRARRRAKKKKLKAQQERLNDLPDWQDDRFFFIAGYTSGGAPYGVTWEEMGLEPWENLE